MRSALIADTGGLLRALACTHDGAPSFPEYEEALYNLGILEEAINPQRSVELLEKAISIDPDYAIAHQALGRYYHRVGDLPRAEYHLRRSLEIDPEDYFSHLYLANNLAVQGRDEEAEHVYRAALKLPAATGRGYGFFADFLDGLGRHEEAQQIRARMPPAT